jgi:BirA family biotin operon repressor/biotin-[acetyl-CoA-carboxylase] ligase
MNIGNPIIELEKIDSTNKYVLRLLDENKRFDEGTVIAADFQYAGKGQDKNQWESEAGKNLTLSIILQPIFMKIEKQFMLNKIIALSVFSFINSFGIKNTSIKWPNDIYIGNKKVAGILINNTIQGNLYDYCVAGLGININQEKFISNAPNPISIKQISGKEYNINECLNTLCSITQEWYNNLKNEKTNIINTAYIEALFQYNKYCKYIIRGKSVKAKITGISEYGRLILQTKENETYSCDFKEIEFVI